MPAPCIGRFAAFSAAATAVVTGATAATAGAQPVATTECGPVAGVAVAGGSAAWLGIPYAEPPVGRLRWQPPVPLTREGGACWNGTLNATDPGPACLQRGRFANTRVLPSEDCLRVSVWAPWAPPAPGSGEGSAGRPVVVWLHGGDLVEGSSFTAQSYYGAEANLTAFAGAVVVGVEYRLGVPGWLALDALAARDVRGSGLVGNYGFLDVLEALRWVQRNAKAFGGDPARVTVVGQSSGGTLVLAIAASPHAVGLVSAGVSMSGSPRLNSTTREASDYWHREVVARTPCASLLPDPPSAPPPPALAECLLGLTGDELVNATPPDWTADVGSFDVFRGDFRYAPILLIDGPGGVLPRGFLAAANRSHGATAGGAAGRTGASSADGRGRRRGIDGAADAPDPPLPDFPLVVGVMRQEFDFGPGSDVRNLTRAGFVAFLREHLEPAYGDAFALAVDDLYGVTNRSTASTKADLRATQTKAEVGRGSTAAAAAVAAAKELSAAAGVSVAPWEPQSLFAEILADAIVLCPSLLLATRMQRSVSSPVYAYSMSQTLSAPFCVAPFEDTAFDPPYCPRYSFHSLDEMMWFRPGYNAATFQYNITAHRLDADFAELVNARLSALVHGGAVPAWDRVLPAAGPAAPPPPHDALPRGYSVVDFRAPDAASVAGLKAEQCEFWLSHGFYESKGLIN